MYTLLRNSKNDHHNDSVLSENHASLQSKHYSMYIHFIVDEITHTRNKS